MTDGGKRLAPESVGGDAFKVPKLTQLACGEPCDDIFNYWQETCYFCSTVAKNLRDAVDGKPLCNDCQVFFSDPSPIVLDLQQLETTAPYSYIHLKQHLG